MAANLPAFTNTPVDGIPTIVEEVRSTFFTQKTKPVEFRLRQLRKLYWGYVIASTK
jgi:beta-apo-4'-carotenal oxygenase